MGVFYEAIPDSLMSWLMQQKMFWIGTAPLSANGHVNLSPKGGECFGIPDRHTFWYHDLTGSGSETIAHLHEPGNGRVTIMFNAFDGPPKIVRLWGKGRVLERGTAVFDEMVAQNNLKLHFGTRSIIVVDIHQVGSSCGFSVPYYDFKAFRPILTDFYEKKQKKYEAGDDKESMDRYWAYKNAWSIDGLPAMKRGAKAAVEHDVAPIKKMVGPLSPANGAMTKSSFSSPSSLFAAEHLLILLLSCAVVLLAVTHPSIDWESTGRNVELALSQVKKGLKPVLPASARA